MAPFNFAAHSSGAIVAADALSLVLAARLPLGIRSVDVPNSLRRSWLIEGFLLSRLSSSDKYDVGNSSNDFTTDSPHCLLDGPQQRLSLLDFKFNEFRLQRLHARHLKVATNSDERTL